MRGAGGHEPLDLGVEVRRGQVEVHAVLPRRRVVDLLEGEQRGQAATLEHDEPAVVGLGDLRTRSVLPTTRDNDSASLVSMVTIPNVSVMDAKVAGRTDSPDRRGVADCRRRPARASINLRRLG